MAKILCKGGRVFDGEKFFFADVLTENEKIIKIESDITDTADFVFDASGKTVLPGLVDAHVHMRGISDDMYGINADTCSLPFGVTTAVDASGVKGSKETLEAFGVKSYVMVSVGIGNDKADFKNAHKMLPQYGDRAVGIKICFDTNACGVRSVKPLKEIVDFAATHGLHVTVHSTGTPVPMAELLDTLNPGDILTHAYHGGKNNVSEDNYECIKKAKVRGVIIDSGIAGHVHTDFKVFKGAVECGALPNIMTTDITKLSAYKRGGRYGLPMCMSIARHLGMNENDIFKSVTSAAAKAIGKQSECGTLAVGRCADICVLEYADEGFDLTDFSGNRICSDVGYRNVFTVLDGEIVYRR